MLGLNVKKGSTLVLDIEGVYSVRILFDRNGVNYTHVAIDAPQSVRIRREEETTPVKPKKARA